MKQDRLIWVLRCIFWLLCFGLIASGALQLLHIGNDERNPIFTIAMPVWCFYQALILLVPSRDFTRKVWPGTQSPRLSGWFYLTMAIVFVTIDADALLRGTNHN